MYREPGHESTNCPKPRSTDGKQCYACGGVGELGRCARSALTHITGHIKLDCPTARQFGGGAGGPPGQRCYTCGRFGRSSFRRIDHSTDIQVIFPGHALAQVRPASAVGLPAAVAEVASVADLAAAGSPRGRE
jgi:hypothetical protein